MTRGFRTVGALRRRALWCGFALAAAASLALQGQQSSPLVQPRDLILDGSFRLPAGRFGASEFAYGGTALAFNAANGSLLMVGHDQQQMVAEVTVPPIGLSAEISGLATAAVLRPFVDVTEGLLHLADPGESNPIKIGGLLPYNGRLYISAYSYYDADSTQQLTHFVSGTDLAVAGDVRGPYRVGTTGAGYIGGYFAEVPAIWRTALGGPVVNGQCCIPIVTRTSYGPALFAIKPADLGVRNPAPAVPLVYYPSDHFVNDWDVKSGFWNGSTEIGGVVIPENTRSALFFGRQGLGPFCYGEGAACGDPTDPYKGTHAYPYAYYVWAYDLTDLAAVKAGQKRPWDVRPYAVWPLILPFGIANAHLRGATYDRSTGRIFVTQAFGDESQPLVHVFRINPGATGSPAASIAPANLRVIR
ncbi:MAG: hypothetical protein ABI868_17590 [Acidobacteriota bacterium]